MKDLLSMIGISKQALWKHQKQEECRNEKIFKTLAMIRKIRRDHKRMGCRQMYYAPKICPIVGRDCFEAIGLAYGFRLKRRRNTTKTTWAQTVEVHPNRIEGTSVNNINQVWQSDIFYVASGGQTYYGITIIDVYSRKLLALHLSRSLMAQENAKALRKAIQARRGHNLVGCKFHSDRGSQYISTTQKQLLASYGMKPSMCKLPQENAYAERVQDTIKNYYLCDVMLTTSNLNQVAKGILRKYNEERPHSNLDMQTPQFFEKHVEKMPKRRRPKLVIFKWDHSLSTKSSLLTKRKK